MKNQSKTFLEHYKFDSMPADLMSACDHIGKTRGCLLKGGVIDYDQVYKIVLNEFRKGLLGATFFELPPVAR